MSGSLILVLGGIRSGKSAFAESLVPEDGRPVVYVATGQAGDAEMSERIRRHQERRPSNWQTLEAPLDPGAELSKLLASSGDVPNVLVDSLDVWLANLLLSHECEEFSDIESLASAGLEALLSSCRRPDALTVLVSSEVGLSPVSPNRLGRQFQDLLGTANQRAASLADQVYLVVAGIPMQIKP